MMAAKAVAELINRNPDLQPVFDNAAGYMVIDAKVTKIPVFGFGRGKGVVLNKNTGKRTYLKVTRADIGGGFGIRAFKVIAVTADENIVAEAEKGKFLFKAGAEAAAGDASAEGAAGNTREGVQIFTLAEGGASVTFTVHVIYLQPYRNVGD